MNRLTRLAIVAALLVSPAGAWAGAESKVLEFLANGETNSLEVTRNRVRVRSIFCHCSGNWAPTPELQIVSMNNGETYASGECSQGANPVRNSKVPGDPQRAVPKGTHIGLKIINAPRKIRAADGTFYAYHVCTATVVTGR